MQLCIKNLLPAYFHESLKDHSAIWGKTLLFNNGERIKIIAPSGKGKTSLIHFLYGIRKDYSGTITYNDSDIKTCSVEKTAGLRASHLSIVFQDLRLFAEQSVMENLALKLQLNPYHQPARIHEMAARLGIADKLGSTCANCSYGEQQRVAIIRALLQPFDFLLLDEPFSHLDNDNAQKAMQLILDEAKQRNAAILYADLERNDFFPFDKILHL